MLQDYYSFVVTSTEGLKATHATDYFKAKLFILPVVTDFGNY